MPLWGDRGPASLAYAVEDSRDPVSTIEGKGLSWPTCHRHKNGTVFFSLFSFIYFYFFLFLEWNLMQPLVVLSSCPSSHYSSSVSHHTQLPFPFESVSVSTCAWGWPWLKMRCPAQPMLHRHAWRADSHILNVQSFIFLHAGSSDVQCLRVSAHVRNLPLLFVVFLVVGGSLRECDRKRKWEGWEQKNGRVLFTDLFCFYSGASRDDTW